MHHGFLQGVEATAVASLAAGVSYRRVFARPGVQTSSDRVQVGLAVDREVCLPREVLTEQSVGVLVRAALPGASRVTEVHRDVGGDGEAAVVGELHAPVPGEARLELRG